MNPSPGPWRPTGCGSEIRFVDANDETTDVWAEDTVGARDNVALVALAPEMREMLLKLEWAGVKDEGGACPKCAAHQSKRLKEGEPVSVPGWNMHHLGCPLDALLEKLR